jgi:hypothetical protein
VLLAASAADAASFAPAAANGSALAGLRFHTVTSNPLISRESARASPILPRPTTPTFSVHHLPPCDLLLLQAGRRAGHWRSSINRPTHSPKSGDALRARSRIGA